MLNVECWQNASKDCYEIFNFLQNFLRFSLQLAVIYCAEDHTRNSVHWNEANHHHVKKFSHMLKIIIFWTPRHRLSEFSSHDNSDERAREMRRWWWRSSSWAAEQWTVYRKALHHTSREWRENLWIFNHNIHPQILIRNLHTVLAQQQHVVWE